jgi:hypothetical protein
VSIGIVARVHPLQEGPHERRHAGQQQGGGQDRQQQVVELVPRCPLEQVKHEYTAHGGRHGSEGHPSREPKLDRVLAPVLVAADRLRDRRVGQVGADRRDRLHPENQDQQWRHQRAPADAGHSDQHSNPEAEPD